MAYSEHIELGAHRCCRAAGRIGFHQRQVVMAELSATFICGRIFVDEAAAAGFHIYSTSEISTGGSVPALPAGKQMFLSVIRRAGQ